MWILINCNPANPFLYIRRETITRKQVRIVLNIEIFFPRYFLISLNVPQEITALFPISGTTYTHFSAFNYIIWWNSTVFVLPVYCITTISINIDLDVRKLLAMIMHMRNKLNRTMKKKRLREIVSMWNNKLLFFSIYKYGFAKRLDLLFSSINIHRMLKTYSNCSVNRRKVDTQFSFNY